MAVRKRYYIWLARAYIKRWKKTIFLSITVGIVVFFLAITAYNYYLKPKVNDQVTSSGYPGTYTLSSAPKEVFKEVSYGLTTVSESGEIQPGAAERWEIDKDGKKYTFYLKKGQKFHDGEELTANNLPLNFEDVKKETIDDYTVVYTLENEYSPFLVSVSKPILKQDLSGLGKYRIKDIELNAEFIKSLTLEDTTNSAHKRQIFFYPTQDALKTAFALGEIDIAHDIKDLSFLSSDVKTWPNSKVTEDVAYGEMVALFYNNQDPSLSDKKVRQALNTALPTEFPQGKRADSPYSPENIFYEKNINYLTGDEKLAKELLDASEVETPLKLEITTTPEYESVAKLVQERWKKLGVEAKIKVVKRQPEKFQILITKYTLPQDPDQYTLWHSNERNNITGYKNLRIDKLLEDGRVTTSQKERQEIYADFQKYLLDDVPASFLYFPSSFSVGRK